MKVSIVNKHEFSGFGRDAEITAEGFLDGSSDHESLASGPTYTKAFARLDAEFVAPELLGMEKAMMNGLGTRLVALMEDAPVTMLADPMGTGASIAAAPELPVPLGEEEEATKIPSETVSYIPIDAVDTEDGLVFHERIRARDLPSRAKHLVCPGDILVSNVRPNRGAVTLLSAQSAGAIASSGFTLVRLAGRSEQNVPKEYVFAFLKTKFGRDQLVRRNRGSMYPAVLEDDVLDLWIPEPPAHIEQSVRSHIECAIALREVFYEAHNQATDMLEEYLVPYGLPPDPLAADRAGVDRTEVRSGAFFGPSGALRFDAEFFRSGYREFDERCRRQGDSFILGDHFELFPGAALTKKNDEGPPTPYLKQAVLTNIGINWSALTQESGFLGSNAPSVKVGDILLACTAHEVAYVGRKVDMVRDIPDHLEEPVGCVPDVMIIRSKQGKPERIYGSYVAAFLRHPAGLYQVQRCIRGVRGGHVYKDDLSRFVRVPIPPADWLVAFEELSLKAEQARNRAKVETAMATNTIETFVESLVASSSAASSNL